MTSNSNNSTRPQHGVKGVYYGGEWLPLEECADKFLVDESKCSGCQHQESCKKKRSQSNNVTADTVYDVCIIGAGCVGAAIARELAKYQLKVLWVEAADDVSQGATKGNSGIVHAGYDDKPGTNRSKYCWPGNQMFPQLDRELRFGYDKNGSLVVATSTEERKILDKLYQQGITNGVTGMKIVEKEELFQMEPHLNPNCIAALYASEAGQVIPYEFTIALAENAVDNGVQLKIRRVVTDISLDNDDNLITITMDHWEPSDYVMAQKKADLLLPPSKLSMVVAFGLALTAVMLHSLQGVEFLVAAIGCFSVCGALLFAGYSEHAKRQAKFLVDLMKWARPVQGTGDSAVVSVDDMKVGGSGSSKIQQGVVVEQETVQAKYVLNCAGSGSDKIANMIGDTSFKIKPRIGDYMLLNRNQGYKTSRTLFPCPDPVLGKGVLVQTTLWGNLILGPTARDMHLESARDMSATDIQAYIFSKCRQLVPSFDPKETIHAFAGARAKNSRGDWIIEPSAVDGRMIHVAGIDSPGLAGCPAIALEVVRLLEEAGCALAKNPSFNPNRAPIITPKQAGMRGLKVGPIQKLNSNGTDEKAMEQNVVCKCEKVTEAEIVRAIRRSLPVDSTQGVRKRTRAGMGHCQADPLNYECEGRVQAIIARDTGFAMGYQVGGRPWPATSTLPRRWIQEEDKKLLETLAEGDSAK